MNVEPRMDDETLMAYADGELDAARRREIEAAMAADPGIAARIAEHTALRARLHAAFDPVLEEPVPERLLAALQPRPIATAARVVALDERRASKTAAAGRRRWSWPEWGAMAASLVVGFVISLRLVSSSEPLVARNGDLYAQGFLAAALSGQLASGPPADGAVYPGISFRNTAGVYCRTFQMAAQAGLACRDGEEWRVQALTGTEAPSSPENYRMAAATLPPAIRAAVESSIDGEPLDAEAEAEALRLGWR